MLTPRSTLTRRVVAALDASPSRIPVLLGGCGSGRTTLLQQLRDRVGRAPTHAHRRRAHRRRRPNGSCAPWPRPRRCRSATRRRRAEPAPPSTPRSPSSPAPGRAAASRRRSCSTSSSSCARSKAFPGLRRVLHDLVDGSALSGNRFVLTSRYSARALRLLRDRSARFEVIHMPALTVEDTLDILGFAPVPADSQDAEYTARTVQALADGRPAYVRALADELAAMRDHGGGDAVSALASRCWRPTAGCRSSAASATSCGCTARAATARSRRFSKSWRRRRADADRDLAAAAAHAGLDQGLSVVARGRRSGDVAPEALQLHRSAAARLGPAALPRDAARPRTTSRAKSTATRCRACRSSEPALAMAAAGGGFRRRGQEGVGNYRDRLN